MISAQTYLNWQKKISENSAFRYFWVFWGIYSVGFVFLAGLYLLWLRDYKVLMLAFAAFVLARAIISPLIYLFYKKQRPYQKLKFTPVTPGIFSKISSRANSFPSDHAISFLSIASVIIFFYPLIGQGLIVVAVFSGVGRVILGYHYLTDVILGWLLGILASLLVLHFVLPIVTK